MRKYYSGIRFFQDKLYKYFIYLFKQEEFSFTKLYAKERVEELRSRISLIQSNLTSLKQNYWIIYKESISSGKTPPFLFPTAAFNRLEKVLTQYHIIGNSDSEQYSLILNLNLLDYNCNQILGEKNKLQEALTQRISGLGVTKSIEQQPIIQVDSIMLPKVYCAIDAVVFDLFKILLGKNWIKEHKYVPVSLLNSPSGGYTVHYNSLLITVPYYDSFRARFWPALAHEVAHVLIYAIMDDEIRARSFAHKIAQSTYELKHMLDGYRETSLQMANIQIHELASDIISCCVCPPSYLSAAINLALPVDDPYSPPLHQIYPVTTHPPLDARLSAMKVVLERTHILDTVSPFQKLVNEVEVFMGRKNLTLTRDSYDFLNAYNKFGTRFAKELISTFHALDFKIFDIANWQKCKKPYFSSKEKLTPAQILCSDWMKRLGSIKDDDNLTLDEYFLKRQNEPKIFEQVIHNLYNHYENLVQNIHEAGMYDICIDLD